MKILENKKQWSATYKKGWLAHLQETGEIDWSLYEHPRNKQTHGTSRVDLSQSRLMFITSTGAYLPGEQEPFDAPNPYGDYSIRRIPSTTSFANLAYAHDHYDHAAIDEDARVALPLPYLQELVDNGKLSSITPSFISFMGYQPDSARVVDEMIPQIVRIAKEEGVQAALLAPVWPLCHQSVGLVTRALELVGIATTIVAWNAGRIRMVAPPRALITKLPRGTAFGVPGDEAGQRQVLDATLALLSQDAPLKPTYFD